MPKRQFYDRFTKKSHIKYQASELLQSQGFGDFSETKWLIYQGRFRFQNKIYFDPSDCLWARPGNKFSIDCIPFTFYPKLYVLFNKGPNVVSSLKSSQSAQNLNLFPNIWFNRTLTTKHFAPIYPLIEQMTGLMLYTDDIDLLSHMQTKNKVNEVKMKEYLQLNNTTPKNREMKVNSEDGNDNFLPLHTFDVTFYSFPNRDSLRKSKYFTHYDLLMSDNFEQMRENLINGCFTETSKIKAKTRTKTEKAIELTQKQLTEQERILKNFENNNDDNYKELETNSSEFGQARDREVEQEQNGQEEKKEEEKSVNIRRLKQQFTNIEKIEKIDENVILNPNLNVTSASAWDLSENNVNSKREIISTKFRIETYYPRALISYLKQFELNPIQCHRIGIGNLFLNENETKENEWRIMNSLEIQTLYGYKNKITQIRPNMDVETSQTWPDIEKKVTLM